jgi:hypothetical protein
MLPLGALDVRTFTRDNVERLCNDPDTKDENEALALKTLASVWTLVTAMRADMVSAKKREFPTRDGPGNALKSSRCSRCNPVKLTVRRQTVLFGCGPTPVVSFCTLPMNSDSRSLPTPVNRGLRHE